MNQATLRSRLRPILFSLILLPNAVAQWQENPSLEQFDVNEVPFVEGCRLELDRCPLRVTGGSPWLHFARLNQKGEWLPERSVSESGYGPVNNPRQIYYSPDGLVGCKVAPRDAMFAYVVTNTVYGAPIDLVRVTRVHWNASTDQYDTVLGFPVTVATHKASRLAITPNRLASGAIDGVHVAWCEENGGTVPVAVRQEHVSGAGIRLWGGNGTVIDNTLGAVPLTQPPSVVSTADGFAVVTYQDGSSGVLQHWTAKHDVGGAFLFGPVQVPGQGTSAATSKCCVAHDGSGGAFFGYATDPSSSQQIAARVRSSGLNTEVNAYWPGPGRAMSMLAMPNGHALLVYRDSSGIRCIDFHQHASNPNTLQMAWTRFVRGASVPDLGDAADTVLFGDTAAIVTTSNEQVHVKAIRSDGLELWSNGGVEINSDTPPKVVTAYAPRWPHIWALGNFQPGYLIGWGDFSTGNDYGFHLAERITNNGKFSKNFGTGLPAAAMQVGSAVQFDANLLHPVRLLEFEFEQAGAASGSVDVFGILGGTYVGNQTNFNAWTPLGSGTVTQVAPGLPCTVTLTTPIALPAGTHALCIKANGFALGSTAASGPALTMAIDDLTVTCGAHVANWPSGSFTSNRVFQGGFTYELGDGTLAATHLKFGAGCYAQSDSFYQHFATAAAAATTLAGNAMTLVPAGTQYTAQWSAANYVPPSGFAQAVTGFLPNADDGVTTIALSQPMPFVGGMATQLFVHSNGNVWLGNNHTSLTPNDYTPTASSFLSAPHTGFWAWHDWNITEPGSGQIWYEEVGTTAYLTWLDVESYPLGVVNRGTMQFQLDLMTGMVTLVWPTLSGNSTSLFGSDHLVGYSPGGTSLNAGSLVLPTALPLTTTVGMQPLALSAAPAPLLGSVFTYTTTNIPEAAPGSGLYLGVLIQSLGSIPGGLDLGFLGAPGCAMHVADLGVTTAMVGFQSQQTIGMAVPFYPALVGVELFAQSAALVAPNSLPNGMNAFGLVTSNGLRTRIGNH